MAIKSFTTRIDEELLKKLRYVAEYDGRTANNKINMLIRECVKNFEAEHGKIELESK